MRRWEVCTLVLCIKCYCCYPQSNQDTIVASERHIEGVTLNRRDPISQKYAVEKLSKMDVYLNPASDGDVLKAIAILPSSSNVDETANPSLRGAAADRSRIYLNGVPIINPIRFGGDNGLGNFSLFNTELVDKQYVYASNPPLIFGNTSAGLVQIETVNTLENEGQQYGLTMASIGMLYNKKMKKQSFIQLYSNYQYDDLFLAVNQGSLPRLNYFGTVDFGANVHAQVSDRFSLNTFNYLIGERFGFLNSSLNFTSDALARNMRYFSVNNLDYQAGQATKIRVSTLFDYVDSQFQYGNILSNQKSYQYFTSLALKNFVGTKLGVQYGVETSFHNNRYQEVLPLYFFAPSEGSPIRNNNQAVDHHYIEPYLYLNYELRSNLGFSTSVRRSVFEKGESDNFLSYQFSSHYEFGERRANSFVVAAGKYHSYTNPTYFIRNYNLLSSEQIALDYRYNSERLNLSGAMYYKIDDGYVRLNNYELYDGTRTFGLEMSVSFPFQKYFSLILSNSYIDQSLYIADQKFNAPLNLTYFVKSQLIYSNNQLFTCSALFTTRPGNNFTAVSSSSYHVAAQDFQPTFSDPFMSTFKGYRRLDFNINRLIALRSGYLVTFLSVNNILNRHNQSGFFYNEDYTKLSFDYFQKRTLYFGTQVNF